jgi:PAS domain S-box-containing protein
VLEISQKIRDGSAGIGLGHRQALMLFRGLPIVRYGIAVVFVGAALYLSLLLHPSLPDAFLIFFLSAVMLAGWFGRTGPGLLAVIISMIAVDYYFIPPYRAFVVELDELPYFLTFLVSAVVTSWLGSARSSAEQRQRAHLDELFEQTPEAIMMVDLQHRVLRVNKEFTHIFGYSMDEVINRPIIDLITPAHLRAEALSARGRLADGQNVSVEAVCQRKDGSYVNVSEVSFPVIANDKCIAYYFIFRDITERKRAMEELQKAQAELAHLSRITTMGELASSIAHEINQPIGAIVTNGNAAVRWLAQKPPYLEGIGEALDLIVGDANRAAEVIGRIRSLLKKDPTPMVHLDMTEVIREVLMLTSYETNRRDTEIMAELGSHLPPILGDRVQLQQVMLNLIMNSLDAMSTITDRPRQLHIKSSRNLGCVLVQVQDSGHGWEPEHSDRIFDPFFTTKKDGIGMGLTISRSIIENHGGRLWAERGTPNGAILKFTLPVVAKTE